jgi:hypothetical protein
MAEGRVGFRSREPRRHGERASRRPKSGCGAGGLHIDDGRVRCPTRRCSGRNQHRSGGQTYRIRAFETGRRTRGRSAARRRSRRGSSEPRRRLRAESGRDGPERVLHAAARRQGSAATAGRDAGRFRRWRREGPRRSRGARCSRRTLSRRRRACFDETPCNDDSRRRGPRAAYPGRRARVAAESPGWLDRAACARFRLSCCGT